MDTLWTAVSLILIVGGIIGSFLPVLPGPVLAYVGMLVIQLRTEPVFSTRTLIFWAIAIVIISILDFVIPLYGTKRFGGTKYGIWGCSIGLLAGFWLGPFGIIGGPFIGAFVGEMLAKNDSSAALKAALGSFLGFLFGTLLKVMACALILFYTVKAIIE